MIYIIILITSFVLVSIINNILKNKELKNNFSNDMCIINNKYIIDFKNIDIPIIKEINIAINIKNPLNSKIITLKLIIFDDKKPLIIKNFNNSMKILSKIKKYNEFAYSQFLSRNFKNPVYFEIIDKVDTVCLKKF